DRGSRGPGTRGNAVFRHHSADGFRHARSGWGGAIGVVMDMRLKRVSVNVLAGSLVLTTLLPPASMAVTLLPARIDWLMAVPRAIFVAALGSGITFAITRNHARLEHGRLRLQIGRAHV